MLAENAAHRSLPLTKEAKSKQIQSQKWAGRQCFRCGSSQHLADRCSRVHSTCSYCGKPGHLAKACVKKMKDGGSSTIHQLTPTPTPEGIGRDREYRLSLYRLSSSKSSNRLSYKRLQLQLETPRSLWR